MQFEIGELDFGGANSLFVRLDRWFRGMQSGKSILGPAIKFKRQGEEIKINIDQHLQKTSKTHQEVLKAIEACHSTLSRSNSAAFFPVEEGGVTEAATGHACAGSFK